MNDSPQRTARPAAILSLLAAALLLPSLFYPFARDQGVFAYVGQVILWGGRPYRDVWELKPPGIYYTYAFMLACTGSRVAGVRLLDLLATIVTLRLLNTVLRRFLSERAAWLGALLYAPLYLRLGYWGMAQAESFANDWLVIALAAWLWSGDEPGRSENPAAGGTQPTRRCLAHAFVAGMAAGAALLLKVTVGPPLVAALVGISLLRRRASGRHAEARRVAALAGGVLVPMVSTGAVMALSGMGSAYLDIQRGFVAGYVALPATGAAAAGWHYFWRLYAAPVVAAGVGLWAAPPRGRWLLGGWLAAALVSVVVQRKYFGYHWTPALLPLAGLGGAGLSSVLEGARRLWKWRSGSLTLALGSLLIVGWSLERPANGYGAMARLLLKQETPASYWARYGRPFRGDFSFLADVWAARYIREHTLPGQPVYIWGFEPLTLFLAGREAPTRFVFAVPLVSSWTPARWQEEFMRDLEARPPVLFGVMRHDAVPHATGR